MSEPFHADIQKILQILPHRYPFLLVDRVTAFTSGKHLTGYKNVTINEPFFQGHFPEKPIMPGVLILEAMAQAGGVFVGLTLGEALGNKLFLFTGLDGVRFRRPVVPGDKLVLTVDNVRNKRHLWKMESRATVDGEVAAEGELTAAVLDKERV